MDYSLYESYAKEMGYNNFTDLQEKAFRSEACQDEHSNLMIVGPTSSGKTLIPQLIYYGMIKQTQESDRRMPKMLFIVPYRALAAQKCTEFQSFYSKSFSGLTVVQSTGEFRQDDNAIRDGEVDIAVMISEKAFLFACADQAFLKQFDLITIDEIGLIADADRGIKLDILFIWINELRRQNEKLRLIALGTPYYSWENYARSHDFTIIQSETRPRLIQKPIYVAKTNNPKRVQMTDGGLSQPLPEIMYFFRNRLGADIPMTGCPLESEYSKCPVDHPSRMGYESKCSRFDCPCPAPSYMLESGEPFRPRMLAQICRYHLAKNHQILIFWNNREEVRTLSKELYALLRDVLPCPCSVEEAQKSVLEACELTEDETYGILEKEHYAALKAGIGFHSSAVPNEIRSYVEQKFLEEKELKIVCSTETLAFGINSAVDVVIIADMLKNVSGEQEYLSANEYQNYIGRAGRLRPGMDPSAVVGYVYPIISGLPRREETSVENDGYSKWLRLGESLSVPQPVYSCLFGKSQEYLPFILLALLTQTPEGDVSRLKMSLSLIPGENGEEERLSDEDFRAAFQFLLHHGLIQNDNNSGGAVPRARRNREVYTLTDAGLRVCGYTPSKSDYERTINSLGLSVNNGELNDAAFIYSLLKADCLKNSIFTIHIAEQGEEDRFSAEKLRHSIEKIPVGWKLSGLLDTENLGSQEVRKNILLTAAILCWADSASPRQIHDWFGFAYPLLQSLTQSLSYLMEIAAKSMHHMPRLSGEMELAYGDRQVRVSGEIMRLSKAVYFGIESKLYTRMIEYFSGRGEPEALHIYSELISPQPSMARQLRRISGYYKFFAEERGKRKVEDAVIRYREIQELGKLWWTFFKENCWEKHK